MADARRLNQFVMGGAVCMRHLWDSLTPVGSRRVCTGLSRIHAGPFRPFSHDASLAQCGKPEAGKSDKPHPASFPPGLHEALSILLCQSLDNKHPLSNHRVSRRQGEMSQKLNTTTSVQTTGTRQFDLSFLYIMTAAWCFLPSLTFSSLSLSISFPFERNNTH